MRLRFWDPPRIETAMLLPVGSGQFTVRLPARRLNLTELDRFARGMAIAVGRAEDSYTVSRVVAGPNRMGVEVGAQLTDVEGLLPDQRLQFAIRAVGSNAAIEAPVGGLTQQLHLNLGDGLTEPATLHVMGLGSASTLEALWNQLGRARRTWSWAYPVGFLLALVATLVPIVVLWAHHALSLWLIPLVLGLIWLAFAVAAPLIQGRVRAHRDARGGLDIDFRLLQRVRLDRAVTRQRWTTGLWSGTAGAVAAALVTWLLS